MRIGGTGLQVWHGLGRSPNLDISEQVAAVLRRFIRVTVPSSKAELTV